MHIKLSKFLFGLGELPFCRTFGLVFQNSLGQEKLQNFSVGRNRL